MLIILLAGNHKRMSTFTAHLHTKKCTSILLKEIVAAERKPVKRDKGPFTISPVLGLAVSNRDPAVLNGLVQKN
jgi:hypothetical protein